MDRIFVDQSLLSRLNNLESCLELCDESGNTLGYFVPKAEQLGLMYAWARSEFTDEEIQRARQERGGLSIAEVLADLVSQ